MKSYPFVSGLFFMLVFHGCSSEQRGQPGGTSFDSVGQSAKLRHIVLFKFKKDAAGADISKVEKAFAQLPEKIKEIKGFEWGINNSPENINKGFTHGYILTFDSEAERDVYLPHPDHKAFGRLLDPVLEDVLVLDYWTN